MGIQYDVMHTILTLIKYFGIISYPLVDLMKLALLRGMLLIFIIHLEISLRIFERLSGRREQVHGTGAGAQRRSMAYHHKKFVHRDHDQPLV